MMSYLERTLLRYYYTALLLRYDKYLLFEKNFQEIDQTLNYLIVH